MNVAALWRMGSNQDDGSRTQLLIDVAKCGLMLTVLGCSGWILLRRPPKSVFGYRVIEFVCLVSLVAINLSVGDDSVFHNLPQQVDQVNDTQRAKLALRMYDVTLGWFVIIVVYGTIIPNTLRRSLAVTVGIALCPLARFYFHAVWLNPIPREFTFAFTMNSVTYFGIAISVVAFSASRIERYRRQAAEARKLGQYVLKERLGAGGMGEVYRAEHALLRRPAAIKLIRPDMAGDPDTLRCFEREVQVTATLTHPNTVQIFDYGHADDGTFFYVMEFLPGLTLEEIVKRHGPVPPGRAVHFLRQVCAALGEAHARGLTHRDIKPGNVMVCERGGVCDVAKVLDFGLVQVPKDATDGGTLTRAGAVAGTPAFMSPEQAGGEGGIDARSDLYSVGALAYFLLTGQPPFAGRSAAKMLAAHLYETPSPLPADVPADLAAVVTRCLVKAPSERWPDAASLEAALGGVAVAAWTLGDAAAWWVSVAGRTQEPEVALATATWAPGGPRNFRW